MTADIVIARTVADLRRQLRGFSKGTVGLVPTMGALHDGHMALVRRSRDECDRTVVSLFVNPKQFNRAEDLASYPRDTDRDRRMLAAAGVDILLMPDAEEMYPAGFATTVTVDRLTECMEGAFRPGHFAGVATVVCKLLLQSLPDRAYFGEKDFQQLIVVSRMVTDLDIPTEIVPVETVREPSGLALASRNRLLEVADRPAAPALYRELSRVAQEAAQGADCADAAAAAGRRLAEAGFGPIDYIDVRHAATLDALRHVAKAPARVFAAAWLGKVRLIDNVAVPAPAAGKR